MASVHCCRSSGGGLLEYRRTTEARYRHMSRSSSPLGDGSVGGCLIVVVPDDEASGTIARIRCPSAVAAVDAEVELGTPRTVSGVFLETTSGTLRYAPRRWNALMEKVPSPSSCNRQSLWAIACRWFSISRGVASDLWTDLQSAYPISPDPQRRGRNSAGGKPKSTWGSTCWLDGVSCNWQVEALRMLDSRSRSGDLQDPICSQQ